jgi:DNA repair protein SbcC/Rad50
MIIAELVIEDYKQFAGRTTIRPDSQGIVAIFGPNGAGKTTLFEAIEWCLYAPSRIKARDVFPRGRASQPSVTLTLEHPAEGIRYVVRRKLKASGAADAQVWREDQPGMYLATGAAPVKKYVTEKLIGMSYEAFAGTFFTRQKELSFFGDLKPTERRRTVGRLLGMEAVRAAQQTINDDRAKAMASSANLRDEIDRLQTDRDLPGELSTARAVVTDSENQLTAAAVALASATSARDKAAAAYAAARDRESTANRLRTALQELDGQRAEAVARRDGIDARLRALDEAEAQRDVLRPVAAAVVERQRDVDRHEEDRRCVEALSALDRREADCRRDHQQALREAQRIVDGSRATIAPDWVWRPDRAIEDASAYIDALISVAGAIDVQGAQQRATDARALFDLNSALVSRRAELAQYESLYREIEAQHAGLVVGGDPDGELRAIDAEELAAKEATAGIRQQRADAVARGTDLRDLVAKLRGQTFDDACPTCARPFTQADADRAAAHLDRQIADLIDAVRAHDAELQRLSTIIANLAIRRATAEQHRTAVAELATRLAKGAQRIHDKSSEVAAAEARLQDALGESGFGSIPTDAGVATATAEANEANTIHRAVAELHGHHRTIQRVASDLASIDGERAAITGATYDRAAHDAARAALEESTRAAGRIAQIEAQLTTRPDLQRDRETTDHRIATCDAQRAERVADLGALAFDQTEVERATVDRNDADSRLGSAKDAETNARLAMRDAMAAKNVVQADIDRLAELERRSASDLQRADDLDRMVREFTEFERYVAARVTPQLAEFTSDLLASITGGKYDHVEFDDDYGLRVYDGPDESFAIDHFSGGERDVIALCARLALSQLIGSSAVNPPSFLVLDETFGALDRDRRAQLLELLGSLPQQTASFQQLFIISHVEDVQASPAFSQVWHISENDAGASEVQNLTNSDRIEEL